MSDPYDTDADDSLANLPPPTAVAVVAFDEQDYQVLPRLFSLLEPALPVATVLERMQLMRAEGWRCIGAQAEGNMVAMAGYSRRVHLFSGPALYVENVVVLPTWRTHGLGQALMQWIEAHARETGCTKITLDAYAVNLGAQAFYQRLGYDPRGVHFVKDLA